MPIALNRLVFSPSVAMVGNTVIINNGIEEAIVQMGAEEAAEHPGTPLNNLIARSLGGGESTGGNGDDLAEFAGRQCYRSWRNGRDPAKYHANIIASGHGSIYEHSSVVFQVTGVSRALTHELIRHRVGTAYSQESQRYVDAKDIRFVVPPLLATKVEGFTDEQLDADDELTIFRIACHQALRSYIQLQGAFVERMAVSREGIADEKALTAYKKRANEAARALLPNAAETRLVFTTNLRALRHIVTLRGTEYADLEIRRLVVELLKHARSYAPHFFADIEESLGADTLATLQATGTEGRI